MVNFMWGAICTALVIIAFIVYEEHRREKEELYCCKCGAKMDEMTEDELVNTAYKYEDATNTSTDEVTE